MRTSARRICCGVNPRRPAPRPSSDLAPDRAGPARSSPCCSSRKSEIACSSGSRRMPCRINSQSAKLICRATALDTSQLALSCSSCAFARSLLQCLDIAQSSLLQQVLQGAPIVQTAADLGHKVFRNVNRNASPLQSPIQNVARMLFARQAGRAILAHARAATKAQRTKNRRPKDLSFSLCSQRTISEDDSNFALLSYRSCVTYNTRVRQLKIDH